MKSKLLLLLILLALGGFIGHQMLQGQGYVLISFRDYVIETSFWVAAALFVLGSVALFLCLQLLLALLNINSRFRVWRSARSERKAMDTTVAGLLALAEGDWKKAQKLLVSGAVGKLGLINYLTAARAAHQAGDHERADELLGMALKSTEGAELAVGLQQAQLQLDRQQYEQCLATCLRMKKTHPKHPFVNKMLVKAYSALEDWQALLALIPQLQKGGILLKLALPQLEISAYSALLNKAMKGKTSQSRDVDALLAIWQQIPAKAFREAEFIPLVDNLVSRLVELNAEDKAEEVLRRVLSAQWPPSWVRAYGRVKGSDVHKQLIFMESQLRERPNDADLLLTLGRLCLRNQLWGKAHEYLLASHKLNAQAETRAELARLYLARGEHDKALTLLNQRLGEILPNLPLPNQA